MRVGGSEEFRCGIIAIFPHWIENQDAKGGIDCKRSSELLHIGEAN